MIYLALFFIVEVYKENLAPHSFLVGKVKSIFIAFSDNLILHQNLTRGSFLKFSYQVESETLPMNFSYSVTLNSICLAPTLNGSFAHA